MTKKITKKQYDLFYDIIERKSSLRNLLRKYNVSLIQFTQWMKQKEFIELIVMTYKYNLVQLRFEKLKDMKIAHAKLLNLARNATGDLLYKVCGKLMDIPEIPVNIENFGFIDDCKDENIDISDATASEILEIMASEKEAKNIEG